MRLRIGGAGLALAFAVTTGLPASEVPGPAPNAHALVGGRVVVGPGRVLEGATVTVRDGIIEAVGPGLAAPPDARIWDLEGRSLYPAFVEAYAALAWPAEEDGGAPATGHPNPLVRPERAAVDRLGGFDAGKLRSAGFGAAAVAPDSGIFRGVSAVVSLGDGDPAANVLRPRHAQNASLRSGSFGDGYPSSQMGAVALFRQTLLDAAWYSRAHAAWEANPAQRRPPASTALPALVGVAAGRETLVLETRDPRESVQAVALARELGLDLVLLGHGREYLVLDEIAAARVPVLVPLDLPETPQAGEEDDMTISLADLRHWRDAPSNPARLIAAGVTIALTTHGLGSPADLDDAVRQAIDQGGLDRDDALAALTTTPAALLGLDRLLGTLEAGRIANLLEVDGELFTGEATLVAVWVDGRRYEVEASEAPSVEPAGTWELTVTTGDGEEIPATLELAGAASSLSGSLRVGDQTMRLDSARVSGSDVILAFDTTPIGIPGRTTLTLSLDGDRARGGGESPAGPYEARGRRVAGPEEV